MARMEMDCILKKWGYRFQVHSFCLGKLAKFWLWFIFSCKFTWYLPFSVPSVFCVRQRYVVLIWGHFDPKTWKSPWRSPCKSSYFGKNDSFYQLFLKKKHFGQNTQLWVGFCQNKVISQSKHTVLSTFPKKNWRHWEQNRKFTSAFLKRLWSPFLALL